MVEDIITGLSRIKWLFVIARNSSFVYKGKSVDIKQVGRELGVRYVLEGSVRKGGNRVRIAGQLIEADTGTHIWADRYDGVLEDVFDLQDKITETIVGIIEPSVRRAEIERARRKRPENLGAYDLYLRALPHTQSAMPEDAAIAIGRAGRGSWARSAQAAEMCGRAFSVLERVVPPHFQSPPQPHTNTREDWAAYVLEGRLVFLLEYPMGRVGDTPFVPRHDEGTSLVQ